MYGAFIHEARGEEQGAVSTRLDKVDTQLGRGAAKIFAANDRINQILVLAPGASAFGESMSLYRAGLKLALFLPLGVAMPLCCQSAVRFHRCELRFQSLLTK